MHPSSALITVLICTMFKNHESIVGIITSHPPNSKGSMFNNVCNYTIRPSVVQDLWTNT